MAEGCLDGLMVVCYSRMPCLDIQLEVGQLCNECVIYWPNTADIRINAFRFAQGVRHTTQQASLHVVLRNAWALLITSRIFDS